MSNTVFKQYGSIRHGPERVIVKQSASWLRSSLQSNYGWLGLDVPVGAGFPDIAYVAFSNYFETRFVPSAVDAELLAYTRSSSSLSAIDYLSKFQKLDSGKLMARLAKLVNVSLVSMKGDDYSMSSWWCENDIKLVTIEAKMSDWKKALRQARRNRLFSTHTFVALPEEVAERAMDASDWHKSGVGLLSVDADGEVECVIPSVEFVPSLWSYYYSVILDVVKYPKGLEHAVQH